AAISTRRSSATGWPGRRSGARRQRAGLGQRDGGGGPLAQEAPQRGPDAGPRGWLRADRQKAVALHRDAARRRRTAERLRATRHVGQGGAWCARRHRRRARRLALHTRLRPAPDLLSGGPHHRDRRGLVVQHLVLEAAARRGPRDLTSIDHLGYPLALEI